MGQGEGALMQERITEGWTGRGGAATLADFRTPVQLRGQTVSLHHAATEAAGPPLVLLHGMASSWRQWRRTMLRLGGEIPLAALDLPGFGDSASTRRPLAAGDFADAAEAWCRARGWPALSAVGHSFGGAVLVDWAARYPERFRSLALIAPAALFHPWYTAGYDFLRWPLLGPLLVAPVIWLISTRSLGVRFFGHIVSDIGGLSEDELDDLQWGCRRAREMRRALDYYRFPEVAEQLARIRRPTLVGWGTNDRVVPYTDAAFYAAHLPQGQLRTWEGCGHVPMLERREAFDALLREVWAAGGGA